MNIFYQEAFDGGELIYDALYSVLSADDFSAV
jgi:hypothetical protein